MTIDNFLQGFALKRLVLKIPEYQYVIEETGGGFKNKALGIFNRVPIAAIRGSMIGLPLTQGLDYLSFASMRSSRKASLP